MTFKDTGTKRTHCQSTETPFINPITEYKSPRQHLTLSRPIALVRKYFNTSVAKQIGLLSAKSKKEVFTNQVHFTTSSSVDKITFACFALINPST